MGDKTAGAPQETIADVMVEMLSDSEGTTAQVPAWRAACKHYYDRLSRAARPELPELDITTIPNDGLAIIIPSKRITSEEAHSISEGIRDAKEQSGSTARLVLFNQSITLEVLSDAGLAKIGLQRIPAA